MPQCKQCGSALNADDQFCGECGWQVPSTLNQTKLPPTIPPPMTRCPACGTIQRTAEPSFCGQCGAPLGKTVGSSRPPAVQAIPPRLTPPQSPVAPVSDHAQFQTHASIPGPAPQVQETPSIPWSPNGEGQQRPAFRYRQPERHTHVWLIVGIIVGVLVLAGGAILGIFVKGHYFTSHRASGRSGTANLPVPPLVSPLPGTSQRAEAPPSTPLTIKDQTSASSKLPISNISTSTVMPDYYDKATGFHCSFVPGNLVDGDLTTCWQALDKRLGGRGQWIQVSLYGGHSINRIDIANGFQSNALGDLFDENSRIREATVVFPDGGTEELKFGPEERGMKRFDFTAHIASSFRLLVDDTWPGTRWQDLSVSEIAVYGK